MQIATTNESFQERAYPLREWSVALPEAVVPHPEELLHGVFDDLFEVVGC
jgi:hypothetical protein